MEILCDLHFSDAACQSKLSLSPDEETPKAMRTQIPLVQHAHGRLIGARETAVPLRLPIEEALAGGGDLVFDFSGVEVTQSFVDALIGRLILTRGPAVLDQLVFKSCSDDVRAIIEFVVTDRADQYLKAHSH